MQPYHYSISLRIKHPTLDPDIITQQFNREPMRQWRKGYPRMTPKGSQLDGEYKESYWCALLCESFKSEAIYLEDFLNDITSELRIHQNFISKVILDGGSVCYSVGLFLEKSTAGLEIDYSLMRVITDLGIDLNLNIYSAPSTT